MVRDPEYADGGVDPSKPYNNMHYWWDDDARRVYTYENGTLTSRPYTAGENARADADLARQQAITNAVNPSYQAAATRANIIAVGDSRYQFAAARAVTTAYVMATTDGAVSADTSSGAYTVTLPSAVGVAGRVYYIKKASTDTNILTIVGANGQTVDGLASITTASQLRPSFSFQSDGANWWLV